MSLIIPSDSHWKFKFPLNGERKCSCVFKRNISWRFLQPQFYPKYWENWENETYFKVRTIKHSSDTFAIKKANKKSEANHKGMKLNVTQYLLVCAHDTNLLGVSAYAQNKNA